MSRSVAPRDLRSQITLDSLGFRGPGSVQDITRQPAPSYSLGAYTSLDHGSIFWEDDNENATFDVMTRSKKYV